LAVGGLEATVGSVAALAVAFGGHTAATLISEGILGLRVVTGDLPSSALHVLDVGPSYAAGAALAALVALPTPRRLRTVAGVTLVAIAPAMMYGVTDGELDGIGHTAALALGALAATIPALRRRAARPAPSLAARSSRFARSVALRRPAPRARSADAVGLVVPVVVSSAASASADSPARMPPPVASSPAAPSSATPVPPSPSRPSLLRWAQKARRTTPAALTGTAETALGRHQIWWSSPRGLHH
ncbi:rhomboid-like protein, partial [Frankia sp. CpI1-P]